MIRQFLTDDSGVSALEYGLLAGLVSLAIIGALTTVGDNLSSLFDQVASQISDAEDEVTGSP